MQSNENMEITSALHSEQHVKKELAKKLGQLQENLGELKETVTPTPAGRAPRWAAASREGGAGARARPGDPRVLQSL